MNPLVAIITPTKNRLKLLCEAMDSVQEQSFAAWEHIVVDDGSDDGTAEEVTKRALADPRIRYIQRQGEKAGANVCRNLGVRESRAEFILFLDSDDLLTQDCLRRRVEIMQRNADLDFATFQTAVFENTPGDLARQVDTDLLGDDLLRFLYFECPWIITGPIWRKTSLVRLGLFDEALPSWQDVDLHIRAITMGLRYLRFPDVDHYVRWQFEPTKVSIEQRRSPRHLESALRMLGKFEQLIRSGPGMNWMRQRALCSLYFLVAEFWVAMGRLSEGLQSWQQIRRRQLGSRTLLWSGTLLLIMLSLGAPGRRIGSRLSHKWKGWMRLRSNPELV